MAASAIFTVNGSVPTGPVLLTPGATCAVALVSTSGASDIQWMFTGASETVTYPTITRTGFSTATFTVPANPGHGAGLTLKLVCTNTGDEASALICVGTTNMIASTETTERGALGWAEQLNTNFRATVTGRVEFATHAAYRAAAELADGTFFTIVSPPGEWRYSASSGAGFTDDDRTILKRTGVLDAANGRAFSTRAGATVPTFDALRGLRGSNQDHVHVQAHTVFGDGGGGIFDRAAIGSYVDDGGTVATASPNAWVRRDAAKGAAPITWWGADPTGVASSDAALSAALTWVYADRTRRSVLIPDGTFACSQAHPITGANVTIRGNGQSSCIYFSGGASVSLFTFADGVHKFTCRDVRISGGAACGRAIFDLYPTAGAYGNWQAHDVRIWAEGGWTYWIYGYGRSLSRSFLQWGSVWISNLGDQMGGYPSNPPANGIYIDGGYANNCTFYIDAFAVVGDVFRLTPAEGVYGGSYGTVITGTTQNCGRGLYLGSPDIHPPGSQFTIHDWVEENSVNPGLLYDQRGTSFTKTSIPELQLSACTLCVFDMHAGELHQDADCYNNERYNSGAGALTPVTAHNLSDIGWGETRGYLSTGFYRGNYGLSNPRNLVLNGDFSRWLSSTRAWGFAGEHIATRCGDGCTDTTRTRDTPHCALLSYSAGGDWNFWIPIAPALDASLLHCMVSFQCKFRHGVGTDPETYPAPNYWIETPVGPSGYRGGTGLGSLVEAEDGWFILTVSTRITQDMVDHGITVFLQSAIAATFYISEISACIGYVLPRHFERASASPFYPGVHLDDNGALTWYTATGGSPAATTDPIRGSAVITGDCIVVIDPVTETSSGGLNFKTLAWRRESSSWVSVQALTGLVGV